MKYVRMSAVNLRRVCAAGVLAAAVAVAAQPAVMPAASAQPCPDVDVVFARGTNDTPGLGRVGTAFVNALQSLRPDRTFATYAVNYPASFDFLAAGDGAVDASRHIRAMAQQCPSTRFVLGGFSQGAAVVDMLVGIPPLGNKVDAVGSRLGDVGIAAPLGADLADNIAALAVFGNPATKFSNPLTSAPPPFGARAIDLCSDGDPICSRGRNPFAHGRYEQPDYADQAAAFVGAFL